MAERIQRSRARGWRIPATATYVGRPSKWGNPWALASPAIGTRPDGSAWELDDIARWFRLYVVATLGVDPSWLDPLRGRDLACWCPLDAAWCHADELLRMANT